jgi:hypothetical protein
MGKMNKEISILPENLSILERLHDWKKEEFSDKEKLEDLPKTNIPKPGDSAN